MKSERTSICKRCGRELAPLKGFENRYWYHDEPISNTGISIVCNFTQEFGGVTDETRHIPMEPFAEMVYRAGLGTGMGM